MTDVVETLATEEVSAPLIDPSPSPAPAADEKKTEPATGAEEQKPETPEQQEVKKQSRRERARLRAAEELGAAKAETRLLREQLAARDAKPAAVEGEPQRDQFESYEDFLRAVAKYDAKQETAATLKADREANQGKDVQTKQAQAQEATAKAWVEREAAVIKANPDYEESVGLYVDEDLGNLSDGARRLIVDSDVGPQVLHHLATHADVHERIAKLSPLRQIVELGKLEDSLAPKGDATKADEPDDKPKVESKKISTAPAPVRPVSGGKSSADGYRDNMSQRDYETWRKSQGAGWAR